LTINGWQRNLFEVEGTAALDHQASGAADSDFGAAFEGSDNEETRRFVQDFNAYHKKKSEAIKALH
jgi:hypothetical protein